MTTANDRNSSSRSGNPHRLEPSRFVCLALAALAALFAADAARAQLRRCEEPASVTGRTCSVAECLALQANVKSVTACGDRFNPAAPPPLSCERITGCFNLRQTRQRWLNCYTARNIINARCWLQPNGVPGNLGHQRAAAQAIQNVYTCDARIALPEPIGCADPCPWGSPLTLEPQAPAPDKQTQDLDDDAAEPAAEEASQEER